MQTNDGRFLSDLLPSRMSTALILSYAFTLSECDITMKVASKRSYQFFEANRAALEKMCVSLRRSMFWGRQVKKSDDTYIVHPPGLDLDAKDGGAKTKMFRDDKGALRYFTGMELFAKSKIMRAHFRHESGAVVAGQSYPPNFSIDFEQLRKEKFVLREIRVKHDPGYYLLAMHFVFRHSQTKEEKVIKTDEAIAVSYDGVWSSV